MNQDKPQQYSPFFLAKCFASYFGSPLYKNGRTIGITGTIIDSVHHLGRDGWRIKLMPVQNISKEHARRILEIRGGRELAGCDITLADNPKGGYIDARAYRGEAIVELTHINYRVIGDLSVAEIEFFRSHNYDIGFSHLNSLIEADIAISAATLGEDKHWDHSRVAVTLMEEMVKNLKYCSDLSVASGCISEAGVINAFIAACQFKVADQMFLSLAPFIKEMHKIDEEQNKKSNN